MKRRPAVGEELLVYQKAHQNKPERVTRVRVAKSGYKFFELGKVDGPGKLVNFGRIRVSDWVQDGWRDDTIELLAETQEEIDRHVQTQSLRRALYKQLDEGRFSILEGWSMGRLRLLQSILNQPDD